MAKRTKKANNQSLRLFQGLKSWFGAMDKDRRRAGLKTGGFVVIAAGLIAGGILAMQSLERYVANIAGQRQVALQVQFLNPPEWMSDSLIQEICDSTGIRSDDFLLDKVLPERWAKNLAGNPWVSKVNLVHRNYRGIVALDCELRRPVAQIRQADGIYYLDEKGVVLPPAELIGSEEHLVELRGDTVRLPKPGKAVESLPLLAGLHVLTMIRQVDEALPEDQRLWNELAIMDVSNYEGRVDPRRAHLMLYTTNETEVRWGAAVGQSRGYAEASPKEKLRYLYIKHRQEGSLNSYRYVDLRDEGNRWSDPLREEGAG